MSSYRSVMKNPQIINGRQRNVTNKNEKYIPRNDLLSHQISSQSFLYFMTNNDDI